MYVNERLMAVTLFNCVFIVNCHFPCDRISGSPDQAFTEAVDDLNDLLSNNHTPIYTVAGDFNADFKRRSQQSTRTLQFFNSLNYFSLHELFSYNSITTSFLLYVVS